MIKTLSLKFAHHRLICTLKKNLHLFYPTAEKLPTGIITVSVMLFLDGTLFVKRSSAMETYNLPRSSDKIVGVMNFFLQNATKTMLFRAVFFPA